VSHAPLDMRYQYLAGGVNTGRGWSTWNQNGTYASMYVSESIKAHTIPVLTYYQFLQSYPAAGTDELHRDISNLENAGTMRAYWSDYELLLTRVVQAAGSNTVISMSSLICGDIWSRRARLASPASSHAS
jgi:hypothetical protein